MEAVPKLPMLWFALKLSPEGTSFTNLKKYIAECYQENPDLYSKEVHELETLRNKAMRPEKDESGCATLKRYYCQLHFLANRFPHLSERSLFAFTWKDLYVNNIVETTEIRFEMAAVLFNIAALHTQVGASVNRVDVEGMKTACTHFQCAAWAFGELKEKFQGVNGGNDFMTPELLVFMQQISFAQAQECILEKSLIDHRKPAIVAKVTAQIISYYSSALLALLTGGDDGPIAQVIDSHVFSNVWKKYVKFKITFLTCILHLYQGQQAEEQQKMGERVALYQAAWNKLEEAKKESKGMDDRKEIMESLVFASDVVEGKRKAAASENDFIYHEAVPDLTDIAAVQGANLVNGVSFSITDPKVAGNDIFARLVPMKAHEAASLYSEEKAQILRKYGLIIEEKDNELTAFLSSLNIEHLNVSEERSNKIPQGIVDRCASLNAKTNAIPDLIASMSNLAEICADVEMNLKDIKELLNDEDVNEKHYQQKSGVHRTNAHFTELSREFQKYLEAHQKAGESNDTLRRAMELHVNNLRILSRPLQEIQNSVPKLTGEISEETFRDLKLILNKVNEMKAQRAQFHADLRIAINDDDIISKVIAYGEENDIKDLFKKELEKHDKICSLIDQNLAAQTNILSALTEAYAKCAPILKTMTDVKHKKDTFFTSLAASYDVYEDLLAKCAKGLEFYKKLQGNVQKLLARVKAARDVQDEERHQRLKSTKTPKAAAEYPSSSAVPTVEKSSTPKLKDYLKSGKTFTGSDSTYIPPVRPNPLGSEAPSISNCVTSTYYTPQQQIQSTVDPPPPYTPQAYDTTGYTNPMYQNPQTGYQMPYQSSQQAASSYQYGYQNYPEGQSTAGLYQQQYPQTGQYSYDPQMYNTQTPYTQPQVSQAQLGTPATQINYAQATQPTSSQVGSSVTQMGYPQTAQSIQSEVGTLGTQMTYTQASQLGLSGTQMSYAQTSQSTQPQFDSSGTQMGYTQAAQTAQYQLGSSSTTPMSYNQAVPPSQSSVSPAPINYNQTAQTATSVPSSSVGYGAASTSDTANKHQTVSSAPPTSAYAAQQQGTDIYPQSSYSQQNNFPTASTTSLPPSISQTSNQSAAAGWTSTGIVNQMENLNLQNSNYYAAYPQQPSQYEVPQGSQVGPVVDPQYTSYPQTSAIPSSSAYSDESSAYQTPGYCAHPGYVYNNLTGDYQYASGYLGDSGVYSQYTNAMPDKSNSSTTNSLNSAGQPFVNQQYAAADQQGQQSAASSSGNVSYYTLPYGYLSANMTPSPSATPQPQNVTANQSGQAQSQSTYMQSNNNNTTQTTISGTYANSITADTPPQTVNPSGNAIKPNSSLSNISSGSTTKKQVTPKKSSNIDLLSGIDFSLSETSLSTPPLQPQIATNSESRPPSQIALQPEPKPVTPPPPEQLSKDISTPTQEAVKTIETILAPEPVSMDRKMSSDNLSICSDLSSLDHSFDWDSVSVRNEKLSQSVVGGSDQPASKSKDPFNDPKTLKYFHKEVERYEKVVEALNIKMLNGNTPLVNKWKELQDMLVKDESKRTTAIAKLFPEKNRSTDCIPYDHARVVLEKNTDDYINAAYVKDLGPGCPTFILAQTPLQNTMNDFWSMIWAQKARTVVCLHTPNEILDTFWPQDLNTEMHFDDISVTLVKQFDLSHCLELNLKVTMNGADAILDLSLLQIKAWTKSSPSQILGIAQNVLTAYKQRSQEFKSNAPLIMNCLTGSERSGIIALAICAILATRAKRPVLINVVDVWYRICSQRRSALRDTNNLQLSMQIVLSHAHDVLNKRGIMTSYQMKTAPTAASIEKEEVKDPLNDLDPLWKLKQK